MAEWKLTNKRIFLSPFSYYSVFFLCYTASQSLEAVANADIYWNLNALTIGVAIFSTLINFRSMLLSKRLLSIAGIIILLLVSLFVTRNVPTWGHHFFLDLRLVFAATVFAWLLIRDQNIASLFRILAKPFLKTGSISYALYVIHMPILFLLRMYSAVLSYRFIGCQSPCWLFFQRPFGSKQTFKRRQANGWIQPV